MAECPNCGDTVGAQDAVCGNCGVSLTQGEGGATDQGQQGGQPQGGQPQQGQPQGGQPQGGQPQQGQPQGGQPQQGQPRGQPQQGQPQGGQPQQPQGGQPQQGQPRGQPQQGQQPPQGQPPQGGGPPRQGPPQGGGGGIDRRKLLIGGGAVVAIGGGYFLFTSVLGGGGPAGTVKEYVNALNSGDIQKANSLIHPNGTAQKLDDNEMTKSMLESAEFSVQSTTIKSQSDGKAVVEAKIQASLMGETQTSTSTFELRKYQGEWRIYSSSGSGI